MGIISILKNLFEVISSLINFIMNMVESFFNILEMIPSFFSSMYYFLRILPSSFIPFVTLFLSTSVVMFILGRNRGGQS